MATSDDARALAASIVEVANGAGCRTTALLTDMNEVLGTTAGNAVEVREAIAYLAGEGGPDAREPRQHEVTIALSAELLVTGGLFASTAAARAACERALASGAAAERFARMVAALGGPADLLERPDAYLPLPGVTRAGRPGAAGLRRRGGRAGDRASRSWGWAAGGVRADQPIDHAVGFTRCRADRRRGRARTGRSASSTPGPRPRRRRPRPPSGPRSRSPTRRRRPAGDPGAHHGLRTVGRAAAAADAGPDARAPSPSRVTADARQQPPWSYVPSPAVPGAGGLGEPARRGRRPRRGPRLAGAHTPARLLRACRRPAAVCRWPCAARRRSAATLRASPGRSGAGPGPEAGAAPRAAGSSVVTASTIPTTTVRIGAPGRPRTWRAELPSSRRRTVSPAPAPTVSTAMR